MCTFLTDEKILESNETTNDLWTVFAPTDQGFDDVQDALGDLMADELLDVLKFHTIPGEVLFSDDLVCETNVTMANAKSSRTTCSTYSGFVFQEGPGNVLPLNPRIIEADQPACNGVVHIVDHVMVPDMDIMELVGRTGNQDGKETKFAKTEITPPAKVQKDTSPTD